MKGESSSCDIAPELIDKIYHQLASKELPELLCEVSELLSATDIAIYTAPPGRKKFVSVVSGCIDNKIHKEYLDCYQHLDNQIKRLLSFDKNSFLTGNDLFTFNEIDECPVHNEYLVPNRIDSQLVYYLPNHYGYKRTFVAMKNKRRGKFSSSQTALFKKFAVLFKSSLDLHDSKQELHDQNQIAGTITDDMKIGVALLNKSMYLVNSNQQFKNYIQRSTILATRDRILVGIGKQYIPIQRMLKNALSKSTETIVIDNENIYTKIKAIPYTSSHYDDLSLTPDTYVLLVLRVIPYPRNFNSAIIQRHLKISPAESRLATHLANGGTIIDYISKWNLSVHTARNQLKSIFNKTGIHTQKELVAKIFETEFMY